jgi:dihydropteroate synthase
MNILEQISPNKPLVMAVLNITPDSFSDGGDLFDQGKPQIDRILTRAEALLESGADILDVGGESTRPGAVAPEIQEELDRVAPVVEALWQQFGCDISVDTSRAPVMRQAMQSGAKLINDVRALIEPESLTAALDTGAEVCLMHMQGSPDSMQHNPQYADPVTEVKQYLQTRVEACVAAGIDRKKICIDPGFGFGKSHQHNMQLMLNLEQFKEMGLPLLVGVSRKGMIGEITGKAIESRLAGSLAMAQIALEGGANILRVHDVAETCDMIRVWAAVKQLQEG